MAPTLFLTPSDARVVLVGRTQRGVPRRGAVCARAAAAATGLGGGNADGEHGELGAQGAEGRGASEAARVADDLEISHAERVVLADRGAHALQGEPFGRTPLLVRAVLDRRADRREDLRMRSRATASHAPLSPCLAWPLSPRLACAPLTYTPTLIAATCAPHLLAVALLGVLPDDVVVAYYIPARKHSTRCMRLFFRRAISAHA